MHEVGDHCKLHEGFVNSRVIAYVQPVVLVVGCARHMSGD
jgi:hypothetical protein